MDLLGVVALLARLVPKSGLANRSTLVDRLQPVLLRAAPTSVCFQTGAVTLLTSLLVPNTTDDRGALRPGASGALTVFYSRVSSS